MLIAIVVHKGLNILRGERGSLQTALEFALAAGLLVRLVRLASVTIFPLVVL